MGVLQVQGSLTGTESKKFEPFIVKVQDGELSYFNTKPDDSAVAKKDKKAKKKKDDDMVRSALLRFRLGLLLHLCPPSARVLVCSWSVSPMTMLSMVCCV